MLGGNCHATEFCFVSVKEEVMKQAEAGATGSASTSRPRPQLTTRKKILFSGVLTGLVVTLLYGGSLVWRSAVLYHQLRSGSYGWQGKAHLGDPLLGHVAAPQSKAFQLLPSSEPVPTFFDEHGFRVPAKASGRRQPAGFSEEDTASVPPRILFLGCSHTYGYGCRAEETFAQRSADALGAVCLNAGVSGYGLAQMLVQAKMLIPRYEPDYVVVQYSPWLVERSTQFYSPSNFGKVPCPYFAVNEEGKPYVRRPLFESILFDLPVDRYRRSPGGVGNAASFLLHVGAPMLLHDDYHAVASALNRALGVTPPPLTDHRRIVDYAYGEIATLCRRHGSSMVIVDMPFGVETTDPELFASLPEVPVVDAHRELLERLPEETDAAFKRAYCHWRGEPPVCVDYHPNAKEHRIIAGTITRSLNRISRR